MNQKEYIGMRVHTLRKRANLSAEALGKLLIPSITGSGILSWEKARSEPSAEYLIQLCKVLDCDILDFYMPENRPSGFEQSVSIEDRIAALPKEARQRIEDVIEFEEYKAGGGNEV